MTRAYRLSLCCLLVAAAWLALVDIAGATPTVWSGFTRSFTRPSYADPPPADLLTANVAFTRGSIRGLYNAVQELEYDYISRTSPADTEWATGWNNEYETIEATNWASLSYTTWAEAYGGPDNLKYIITWYNAVVHLISDDVYLDLQFTAWDSGGGGGFSYLRAEPPAPITTGDYNGNGVVDAADYTVWRDTFGQAAVPAGSGADGNVSGTIDPGDYTFWKERFGDLVPGAGAMAAAVPEPSEIVLVLVCLALLSCRLSGRRPCA